MNEIILAEGKVELLRNWQELEGVYLDLGENKNIGLNELLNENQAIELEGKQVILKLEIKDK